MKENGILGIKEDSGSGSIKSEKVDEIKAVRREITNVYTKGTYNPGKASGEKEQKMMYWGKFRDRSRFR